MRQVSTHTFGAPSATLLKFLRAQTDGVPFFSTNAGACTAGARPAGHDTHGSIKRRNRRLSTCATSGTLLESSSIPRLSFWPWRGSNAPKRPSQANTSPLRDATTPPYNIHNHSSLRSASSDSSSGGTFWPFSKPKKSKAPLQPDDLPPLSDFLDDNTSLGRTLRPANELKLRCTEFDGGGNVTLVNGEFKKSELIAKVCLSTRIILVRKSMSTDVTTSTAFTRATYAKSTPLCSLIFLFAPRLFL